MSVRSCYITVAFILSLNFISAQNKNLQKFILPGYQLLDTLSGDLNLDGRKDMLLALKVAGEDTMQFSENARPLLVLIKQVDGTYYQAVRNNEVVMCKACGGVFGDPYSTMVIKNGYFSVEHYGGSNWRWTDIATFKYDKKQNEWFLSRLGGDSFHTTNPEKITSTIKTSKQFGVVEFEKFKERIKYYNPLSLSKYD